MSAPPAFRHPGLGLKRAAIAFVARGAVALAMAPFNAWPVLFVTFPIAVWLIDGAAPEMARPAAAASRGGWFGLGYFVAGLYWIGNAFLVDAPTFAWLMPFAVAGPAGVSRILHRAWLRAGAPDLDARRAAYSCARCRR